MGGSHIIGGLASWEEVTSLGQGLEGHINGIPTLHIFSPPASYPISLLSLFPSRQAAVLQHIHPSHNDLMPHRRSQNKEELTGRELKLPNCESKVPLL